MAVLKRGSSAHVPSSSRKADGRRRRGGHGRDREGASMVLGVLRSVAGGDSPGLGWDPGTGHGTESAREFRVSS